ncbi:hypothetical protein PUN28_009443 [Cardiocondyla obscurior]|uniref:Uncharacterized protein n=1 Tax=Cardiocondyla obscurior TaxID=286306 RepID=A0AAW2FXL0_9HYME
MKYCANVPSVQGIMRHTLHFSYGFLLFVNENNAPLSRKFTILLYELKLLTMLFRSSAVSNDY